MKVFSKKEKGYQFKALPVFQLFVLKLLRSLKKKGRRLASVNFTTFEQGPRFPTPGIYR